MLWISVTRNDANNVVQRYEQSIASSERAYRSAETIDDALKTPWALHHNVERRLASPNFTSNSTQSM
jgi:hypothetical protein